MLLAAGGALVLSLAVDAVASAGRIRAGVRVGGLELGGLTFEEADEKLTGRAKLLAGRPVTFTAPAGTAEVTPEQVAFFPDVDATLERAQRVGRDGHIFARIWQRLRSYVTSSDIGWRSDLDRERAGALVKEWGARFDDPGHEAGIEARDGRLVPVPQLAGRSLDREGARAALVAGLERWPRRPVPLPFQTKGRRTDERDATAAAEKANELIRAPITLSSPDGTLELAPSELAGLLEAVPHKGFGGWSLEVRFSPEAVKRDLAARMQPFERPTKDASFAVSGNSVSVIAGQDGLAFDPAKTAEALDGVAASDPPRTVDAAFSVTQPKLTTDQAKALRITELVSTFTTRHPAGQPRVKNIHLMADRIDGTIVRPGETFSLNRTAGERTAEKGYVLAPMIYDGEFKDQVGGGVSQFATTIFNAIFFGGYDIVSYKAHSYYISRYPAGREATVSWPAPDLKFRNDSASGIMIKTSYSSTSITVTFYGDKEGRTVTAEAGERTNPKPPEEKRTPDPGVPPGTEKVTQEGGDGFDIVVFRVISKDGKVVKRERFFTRYLPEPRIILVGPGTPAPSSAPPEGTPAPTSPASPRTPATPGPQPTPSPTPRGALP